MKTILGACPALTFLLRRTICSHLRRSRPEKILNVFQREGARPGALGVGGCQRLHLRVFENLPAHRLAGVRKHDAPSSSRRAPCGLASCRTSFASLRAAMSDRLLAPFHSRTGRSSNGSNVRITLSVTIRYPSPVGWIPSG